MAPDGLTLSPETVDGDPDAVKPCNGDQTPVDVADDGNRPPRLPRWTRQEILVLIQGKRVAENRVRRSRIIGSAFGSNQLEPKWNSVSSYCKRHGVNRGPVQCRKRWSNLSGDFKKIKEWESHISGANESFWVMRNDLRRERKLPGFFDRDVYDILDGGAGVVPVTAHLTVAVTADDKDNGDGVVSVAEEENEEEEALFDSGRSAAADDGLFSDFEQSGQEEAGGSPKKEAVMIRSPKITVPSPLPISEKRYQPIHEGYLDQGMANQKQQASDPGKESASREGQKRRRLLSEEGVDTSLQDQLIKILERNSRMLTAQIEAQNINCELDRDQRKDYNNNLVVVLSKLADTLGRIADKL